MKWFFKTALPLLLIALSVAWFGYQYFLPSESARSQGFEPVTPISKLRLSQLDDIRNAVLDPAYRSRFTTWESKVSNGLPVITATLNNGKDGHTIILLPGMVQVRFKSPTNPEMTVIIDDDDFDGVVDVGVTAHPRTNTRVYIPGQGVGMGLRRSYQDLYEEHTSYIAAKLGL